MELERVGLTVFGAVAILSVVLAAATNLAEVLLDALQGLLKYL